MRLFKGLLVVALTLTVFVAASPKADAMLISMTVDQLAEAASVGGRSGVSSVYRQACRSPMRWVGESRRARPVACSS